jgi:hypothetical protein
MRHTMNDHPQRLPNGQWRCESGSGYGGPEWCSRPAAWVIEGLTTASPGALLCAEHYEEALRTRRSTVRYVQLDNPTPPSAPSPRDEGRGLDALAAALPVNEEADRRVDALFARQPLGPARTSVAARDEGRAREALREIDALASELEVQAHNEGVECERGGPHEATPKAARKALLDAVARALSPSLGTEGR